MNIPISVEGQHIASETFSIVDQSKNFVSFVFLLSDDWEGLDVIAQFRQGGNHYNVELDDDKMVTLPAEITCGICNLTLYGTGEEVVGTTDTLSFMIEKCDFVTDDQEDAAEP